MAVSAVFVFDISGTEASAMALMALNILGATNVADGETFQDEGSFGFRVITGLSPCSHLPFPFGRLPMHGLGFFQCLRWTIQVFSTL